MITPTHVDVKVRLSKSVALELNRLVSGLRELHALRGSLEPEPTYSSEIEYAIQAYLASLQV